MRLFKKINVIGTSGTGKSTFSKKLAQKLNYPHIEMDQLFWDANWTLPTDEKFFSKLKMSLDQDTWVLDGNYTRSVPIKWEKVDLVIWLDFSFSLTLYQAVKRAFMRSVTKQELWPGTGNRESFRKSFFSKESVIWWMITTHKSVRLKYENYLEDPNFAHIKFVRLRSHRQANEYLSTFDSL